MGCEKAELLRLVRLLEYEMFERPPKPKTIDEVKERFYSIKESIDALSIEDLKYRLGI